MSDTNSSSQPNPNFQEVARVRHPAGVIAVITKRVTDGRISFSICREFDVMERGEKKTKTSTFLARRHIPAVVELLNDLAEDETLDDLEDRARTALRDR